MAQLSKTAERDRTVLRLRIEGLTFGDIADEVGFANKSSARKAYDRALRRTGTLDLSLADHQALELSRLEEQYRVAWRLADRGDLAALREAGRISALRTRLLGLRIADGRNDRRSQDESDHGDENVIGPSKLQEMRERRDRDAAARLSAPDPSS